MVVNTGDIKVAGLLAGDSSDYGFGYGGCDGYGYGFSYGDGFGYGGCDGYGYGFSYGDGFGYGGCDGYGVTELEAEEILKKAMKAIGE